MFRIDLNLLMIKFDNTNQQMLLSCRNNFGIILRTTTSELQSLSRSGNQPVAFEKSEEVRNGSRHETSRKTIQYRPTVVEFT